MNPKLPEPEPNRRRDVQRPASRVKQRKLGLILVLGRVDVPQPRRLPRRRERRPPVHDIMRSEGWAAELRHLAALIADPGPQLVAPVVCLPLQPGPERDLALAERRVNS